MSKDFVEIVELQEDKSRKIIESFLAFCGNEGSHLEHEEYLRYGETIDVYSDGFKLIEKWIAYQRENQKFLLDNMEHVHIKQL